VDLYKAIRELVEERKRVDRIIASLEAMLAKGVVATERNSSGKITPGKRRGRKSMSPEERLEVSERMARYWATKRSEKSEAAESGEPDQDTLARVSS
jgi:hypothetical protein